MHGQKGKFGGTLPLSQQLVRFLPFSPDFSLRGVNHVPATALAKFREVFVSCLPFAGVLERVQTRSNAFGCVRMQLDAFRYIVTKGN